MATMGAMFSRPTGTFFCPSANPGLESMLVTEKTCFQGPSLYPKEGSFGGP
jgi:hypothetical protein